jgi:hypothetical protein
MSYFWICLLVFIPTIPLKFPYKITKNKSLCYFLCYCY